jgi:hypothetical protein
MILKGNPFYVVYSQNDPTAKSPLINNLRNQVFMQVQVAQGPHMARWFQRQMLNNDLCAVYVSHVASLCCTRVLLDSLVICVNNVWSNVLPHPQREVPNSPLSEIRLPPD